MSLSSADRKAVKSASDRYNITDLLIMDHHYLRECIKIIKVGRNEEGKNEKKETLKYAKSFLDTLKKHSEAEKKAVYASLSDFSKIRSNLLESEIEHAIIDSKVKSLIPKFENIRTINDELQAELKVLCDLVEHHLKEEEREMIPKIKKSFSKEILNMIGKEFMKLRAFTAKDLQGYPDLQEEVELWSVKSPRVSVQFLNKVHQYIDNLAH